MRSVTNHAVGHMAPSLYPQMSSNPRQRVPQSKSSGVEGCFACRWRRKKCQPVIGIIPSPSHPCSDCAKFRIRCEGGGLERPAGRKLAKTIRTDLKRWISDRKNRHHRQLFDLTPYYNPQTSAPPMAVNVAPAPTTHTVHQESPLTLDQPTIVSTYEHDLTRVIIHSPQAYATDRTGHNTGAGNGQPQSSSPHHYAAYSSRVQSNHQNYSPALGELNHFPPHVSDRHPFRALDVRDRCESSGSSEWGNIGPNDHHLLNQPFVAHNFYPSAGSHNDWRAR